MDPVSSPVTSRSSTLSCDELVAEAMKQFPTGATTEQLAQASGLTKDLVHKILVLFRKSGKASCVKYLGWKLNG